MTHKPEFSYPMAVRRIGESGMEITVEATPEDCKRVAQRLKLAEVSMLRCRYALRYEGRGVVVAQGALAARFMQTCVVSLETFEDMMTGSFVVRFVPAEQFVDPDMADMDAVDEIPYEGQTVDLGEAAVEQFALDLDPYPHAPDVVRPAGLVLETDEVDTPPGRDGDEEKVSPFAALSRWRGGQA